MKKNKLKILYALIVSAMFAAGNGCAFATETVVAKEIRNITLEDDSERVYESVNNYLGDDYHKSRINLDRPEMHIKSIGEILEEKKKQRDALLETPPASKRSDEPDIVINCKEMEYFEDRSELEARGDVEIITPNGSRATSDKAIFNRDDNTLRLIDNVVLYKGDAKTEGEYMLIDLNEENALMDEVSTKISKMIINAQEGYAYSDRIENLNGNVEFQDRMELNFQSSGFTKYNRAINNSRLVDFSIKQKRSKPYSFKTKEVVIRPQKDHDSMVFKDVDVYYKDKKILNVPFFEMFSDKELTYTDVNFPPEFGSLKGFGTYFGLGYTFKLPKTYSFRLTPALTYAENNLGMGVIGQLKSKNARLDMGWSSSMEDLIVDGNVRLTDKIGFDFGRHVFKNEWINGGNRAGYMAELAYDDSFLVRDLGDAVFRQRLTAGFVTDYQLRHQEDGSIKDGFRYRYQTELRKPLAELYSKEQDSYIKLFALGQTMTTLYSQGDLFALFRVGPAIESKVKRWNSSITYTIGGIHGRSPYIFDEYRYGRQTISFDESLILNRFISVGYRGTLTPLKDNFGHDILTENKFYAVVGPEDIKVAFSYDSRRKSLNFDFLFLIGSDNLNLKYDKLTIENPEKIGKHQKKESDRDLYKVKVPEAL